DPRVLQLAGDLRLVHEPTGRGGRRAEPVLQHLDRHLPAEGRVGGAVDHAHPAAGNLLPEGVPSRRGRWGVIGRRESRPIRPGGAFPQARDIRGPVMIGWAAGSRVRIDCGPGRVVWHGRTSVTGTAINVTRPLWAGEVASLPCSSAHRAPLARAGWG